MLGDLGKLIVAKGFKKLPKIQKIAWSGHTANDTFTRCIIRARLGRLYTKNIFSK